MVPPNQVAMGFFLPPSVTRETRRLCRLLLFIDTILAFGARFLQTFCPEKRKKFVCLILQDHNCANLKKNQKTKAKTISVVYVCMDEVESYFSSRMLLTVWSNSCLKIP